MHLPFPTRHSLIPSVAALILMVGGIIRAEELSIATLDLGGITQGWGDPHVDRSVDEKAITIAGKTYDHGLGTHAPSRFTIDAKGSAKRFTASVGVDDETGGKGSVVFQVFGDGKALWSSGLMKSGAPAKAVDVDISGMKKLLLVVGDGGDGESFDHADWANAVITYEGAKPEAFIYREAAVLLTPKPSPKPRLNGAKVVGARPGSPFLFTVPVTGERPMKYQSVGLPAGLTLDPSTGIITGVVATKGEHVVGITASNNLGTTSRNLKIVIGDKLALTPPMGWNSWNCFAHEVTEKNVRDAADAFVKAGLREHGWTYINIDDFWMPKNDARDVTLHGPDRDAAGKINANPRFPDMKKLTDHIHSLGLKAGIYSSPGPKTCGGCVASYKHEREDAERWAEWGFDYLKYDWCSYGNVEKGSGRAYHQKPYILMGEMLKAQKRDIVFSLCQYGMDNVWEWGDEVNGNCWRTTGDITDTWGSLQGIGFSQAGHESYSEPGRWNDPDMLIVGWVGWGPALHPTRLTPNEQYTHISLWCLLASPLLIGCDMTKLDDFTLNLLTNDEVLAVNQDPLGYGARRVIKRGTTEVYAKLLEDGSKAVGLFNLNEEAQTVSVRWRDLELLGAQAVRDLWRQQDLGVMPGGFEATVPRHGCVLIKVGPAK